MERKDTPHTCTFNGERRAIIEESESFYFFAVGYNFEFNYALKELCTDFKWHY